MGEVAVVLFEATSRAAGDDGKGEEGVKGMALAGSASTAPSSSRTTTGPSLAL